LISLISFAFRPELAKMPLLLRTLTVSTLMVLPLTLLIMPNVTRLLRRWLSATA
jgi:antibiotic biosynthesis monooxygenase (ABM) superfamily enzyme